VGRGSWHEAFAWCDWLKGMLATSPALAASRVAALVREDGWRVGLPSELEWEKAARGGLRGAVFPWGVPHHRAINLGFRVVWHSSPGSSALISAPSALCHSGISDSAGSPTLRLWRGCGGDFPRRAHRRFSRCAAGSAGPRSSVVVAKLRDQEIFTVDTVHHAVLVGDPT
jgi:hypothetical protein